MVSINELREKFPQIPLSIIIKTDLHVEGIKYSAIMAEVGRWALPTNLWFADWSYDVKERNKTATDAWLSVPETIILEDGTTSVISFTSNSPYEVRIIDGKTVLYRDDEPLENVSFQPKPKWFSKRTSTGTAMTDVAGMVGDCFIVTMSSFCEYWKLGQPCKFCSMSSAAESRIDLGMHGTQIRKRITDVTETFRAALEERAATGLDLNHYVLTGGAFVDRKKEAQDYIQTVQAMTDVIDEYEFDVRSRISSQAFENDDAEKLHDVGLYESEWNLEVWDEQLFPVICPGKAKHVGREKWIKSMIDAVKVFGEGRVVTNLIVGCEQMPPHGFKSQDEGLKSNLSGAEELIQQGISPRMNHLIRGKGSVYEGLKSVSTEYLLETGYSVHELMKRYGLPPQETVCNKCDIFSCGFDYPRLLG